MKILIYFIFFNVFVGNAFTSNHEKSIRVLTAHYEPFIYQNLKNQIYNGIEFKLISSIAKNLGLTIECITPGTDSASVDVITTGASHRYNQSFVAQHYIESISYLQDDLTWCIQKSKPIPIFFNYFLMTTPEWWIILIFFCGFGVGTFIYFHMQFDTMYEHRNRRDWNYCVYLIVLPAVIGIPSRYNPQSWINRLFFAFLLIMPLPIITVVSTYFHNFMKVQFYRHQISTVQEIINEQFRLTGDQDVLDVIEKNTMYSRHMIDSFYICDINDCLNHLKREENSDLAVGGSRQHILNCPEYTASKIYCFKHQHNVANYQPSLLIRADFHLKPKIDRITRNLFEAGIFVKWTWDSQRRKRYEITPSIPSEMQLEHLYIGLIFLTGIGNLLAITCFFVELIVSTRMKQQQKHRIWEYLNKYISDQRHYFINWPHNLQRT